MDYLVDSCFWTTFGKLMLIPLASIAAFVVVHSASSWITCAALDIKLWLESRKR